MINSQYLRGMQAELTILFVNQFWKTWNTMTYDHRKKIKTKITVTSHERHGDWNHQQPDSLCPLIRLTTKDIEASHYWSFCEGICAAETGDSPQRGSVVHIFYVMTPSRGVVSSYRWHLLKVPIVYEVLFQMLQFMHVPFPVWVIAHIAKGNEFL